MTDVGPLLHTGTHTGIWGAVELLFAVAVLLGSVTLVMALLREARDDTLEARLAAAFLGERDGDHRHSLDRSRRQSVVRREE